MMQESHCKAKRRDRTGRSKRSGIPVHVSCLSKYTSKAGCTKRQGSTLSISVARMKHGKKNSFALRLLRFITIIDYNESLISCLRLNTENSSTIGLTFRYLQPSSHYRRFADRRSAILNQITDFKLLLVT